MRISCQMEQYVWEKKQLFRCGTKWNGSLHWEINRVSHQGACIVRKCDDEKGLSNISVKTRKDEYVLKLFLFSEKFPLGRTSICCPTETTGFSFKRKALFDSTTEKLFVVFFFFMQIETARELYCSIWEKILTGFSMRLLPITRTPYVTPQNVILTQNVIKYATQNVITFLTHNVITQNVIQIGTRSQSIKSEVYSINVVWYVFSSVLK